MIDPGPHAIYIVSSYLGAALVVLFLIVWTMFNAHRQKSRLEQLEKLGIRRQSALTSTREEE